MDPVQKSDEKDGAAAAESGVKPKKKETTKEKPKYQSHSAPTIRDVKPHRSKSDLDPAQLFSMPIGKYMSFLTH